MERLFNEKLMAIVPEYVDNRGNCTIVYTVDKQPIVLEKTIKTVLGLLGRHYMIDLNEVKKRYSQITLTPNLIPIPLSKENIFVPFKIRRPLYKNDGAFGYINMRYIKKISKVGGMSLVQLKNGAKIKCISSLSTVEKHMKNGNIVSRCYEDRTMTVREEETIYNAKLIIIK